MNYKQAGLLGGCLLPIAALAAPVPGSNCNVLPADNVWNTDISALPVHAQSAAWLASMSASSKNLHPDFGAKPYGFPFIVVPGTHSKVSVSFTYADQSDPGPYPLDAQTPIEGGSDAHALMIDQDACVLYELYATKWNSGKPTAGSGAIFDLASNALRPAGWTSADAAGLPIFPGLVRYDEVQAGAIHHAIRFTAAHSDKSYLWPARHQAGSASNSSLPPMGARFRLKADYDISGYSAQAQVILTAMKHYGMIVADNGSDWFFQGTQDSRWGDDVLNGLKGVPATEFEAVDESSLMLDANSGQARQPVVLGPVAAIDPSALDFGDQTRGTHSDARTVTLTNNGDANVSVGSVTLSGPNAAAFVLSGDGCTSGTIAPHGSCPVSVSFAPGSTGQRNASLKFADNAPDSPQSVALTGNSLAPVAGISLAPASIAWGRIAVGAVSGTRAVTVSSTGTAPLVIGSVALSGGNAGDFAIAADHCSGKHLANGKTCKVVLSFAPAATGARSTSLLVGDNAPGNPHNVPVSGTGK
ncbi:MAG TPA: choice-of-anchor D domain-containing protein [Nevskiaceae bacterium]|nr:choice-of-anchor D domain-containing protein [Nevskiaceae bacterium]